MSALLEEAIVDAKALKEAALKNAENVVLENNVFVGPHAVFTTDKNPPSFGEWRKERPTIVKSGASIGANSTILPNLTIGEGSVVGAGSVVTKDVPDGVTVVGNPARILK